MNAIEQIVPSGVGAPKSKVIKSRQFPDQLSNANESAKRYPGAEPASAIVLENALEIAL
jgi:hypothetical protein